MIRETGFCRGIENYSRIIRGGRREARLHLNDYFPEDFLLVVDESHVTVPKIRAMFNA
jgi:excinuclease ABC subunit B